MDRIAALPAWVLLLVLVLGAAIVLAARRRRVAQGDAPALIGATQSAALAASIEMLLERLDAARSAPAAPQHVTPGPRRAGVATTTAAGSLTLPAGVVARRDVHAVGAAASSLAQHRPTPSRATRAGTRPVRRTEALTGFKLGVPLISLDRERAALRGLTRGWALPYGLRAEAACIHDLTHAAPVRGCECGFHAYLDPYGAWSTWLRDDRARNAVLLEVGVSGRFIRYERGVRFQTQQLRSVQTSPCPGPLGDGSCGRAAELFVYRPADATAMSEQPPVGDPGVGVLEGWVRLRRRCAGCVPHGWGVVGFTEFADRLGLLPGAVRVTGGEGASPEDVALLAQLQDAHPGWSAPSPPPDTSGPPEDERPG